MTTDRGAASATASASRVRYLKRARNAAGLWPWGWLPLLGLAVVFVYGVFVVAPEIQAHTLVGVTKQLQASEVAVLDVAVRGQRVLVRANVSADKRRIRSALATTTCRTWLGEAVCPTGVDIDVVAGSAAGLAAGAIGTGIPARGADAEGRPQKPHRFNFKVRENVAVLRGEVPSEEVRRALVLEATSLFDNVSDLLKVTRDEPDASFGWANERALKVLAALHSGQVIWQSGKMSVRGVATADNQAIIRNALTTGADPRPGLIHLDPLLTPEECNAQFATLLDDNALRFARGSSELSPESAPVLEKMARLARECNRQLVVAGHTDSRGQAQRNRDLSLARAQSVKDALVANGVPATRLVARGYGDAQPVADNATQDGRAANRRIEILVMEDMSEDAATDPEAAVSATAASGAAECNAQFEALLDRNALRFARGSPTLSADSEPILDRVAQLARECEQPLTIAGHTDSRGQPQDNQDLSKARAESVRAALIARGVPAARLGTRGYGDARPIADNATAAGRAANRRIEIMAMEGK